MKSIRRHLKFISLVSVASIIIIVVLFQIDPYLSVYVAVLADVIQIVSYSVWLLQKEVSLEDVPKQVEVVYKFVQQKEKSYRAKEEIVSRLVNEGIIPESEIFSLIRDREIFLAFPYGKSLPQGIKKLGFKRPSHIILLEKIGFVRVTRNQNLMVAFTESLPKSLRNVDNLNAFIERELPKIWDQISGKATNKFPPSQYKWYEKWRTGEGFSVSFVLSKSIAQDFVINYVGRDSFTTEFKNRIWGVVNRKELKKVIKKRRHQVKTVISKISVDLLLVDMPKPIKERILKHEDEIKKKFNIKTFTDYRFLEKAALTSIISDFLPEAERENAHVYSFTIINESQKCYDLLKQIGIKI